MSFALCAGIFFASCLGGGKGSVLSAKAYKYELLDDGTVFVKVILAKRLKVLPYLQKWKALRCQK